MITVITRTSGRPNFFANCRKSVLAQTRPAFHLVISDDSEDAYPEGDKVVRLPIRSEGRGVNQYFNWVFQHIPAAHPWVMFLDDDDQLQNSAAIETIERSILMDDDLLLWQVQFPQNRLIPGAAFGQVPAPGNISGIGFCYHARHLIDWPGVDFGDFMVISQLYNRLRPVWINAVLTGVQTGQNMGKRNDYEIRTTTP